MSWAIQVLQTVEVHCREYITCHSKQPCTKITFLHETIVHSRVLACMRIFQATVRFVKMIVFIFLLLIRMDLISGLQNYFSSYDHSAFAFLHSCFSLRKKNLAVSSFLACANSVDHMHINHSYFASIEREQSFPLDRLKPPLHLLISHRDRSCLPSKGTRIGRTPKNMQWCSYIAFRIIKT